ncbi:MAG: hypothetical protein A2Y33_02540 [Spirochaetes bacterium GWF1_51_8]|nr:MAG: hypothetical protein A2Y33_02540 [Spirochaetes bacterium GWF1_51_8]
MPRLFLSAVMAVLIAVSGFAASLKFTVAMESRKITVQIKYKSGMEKWAQYVEKSTSLYLPALEKYFGKDVPIPNSFTIYGEDKTYLDGKQIGGKNDGKDVYAEYGISPAGNPALVLHEINHFLFPIPKGDEWCVEGAVSFLPLAMLDRKLLDPEIFPLSAFYWHWGLHALKPDNIKDYPVYPDFRDENDARGYFYLKTFKVHYILFKELGADLYREFLLTLIPRQWSESDLTYIPAALNSVKEKDWKAFLSGWVYKGKYGGLGPDSFLDQDHDGLIDIDEIYGVSDYKKTDTDGDMIPDGAEIELGTDPVKPDPASVIEKYGPFPDGIPGDWGHIASLTQFDNSGDGSGGYDFTEMQYSMRDGFLYVIVRSAAGFKPKPDDFFDILMDTDLDGTWDFDCAFYLSNPGGNWFYRVKEKDSFDAVNTTGSWNFHSGSDGKTAAYFEFKISLAEIGSPKMLKILPIIRDQKAGKNYDEMGGWMELLWFDASDTYAEIVEKYGVIIDGMDTEWSFIAHETYTDKDIVKAPEAAFDLQEIGLYVSGNKMYVTAKTLATEFPIRDVNFTVRIDIDGDSRTDYDCAMSVKSPGYPWVYFYSKDNWKIIAGHNAGLHDVFEMQIPLDELKLPKKFKISPAFWDNGQKKYLDEWYEWIPVEVK